MTSCTGVCHYSVRGTLPWCSGCLEDFDPGSGGLLMSMVCIAMMSGPVKHSTYWSISGSEQYWNNTGSCWRRERGEEERKGERKGERRGGRGERRREGGEEGEEGGEVHSEPKALELVATIPESAVSW